MSNFFYRNEDYSLFQKAFKDTSGEDVVVELLSTDDSLKEGEVIVNKHVIRKDNRFSQESSFNKFFGPRRSLNRNFDMKDFSSWKNKNYRETEKQLGVKESERTKFSFADFMNERSGGKTYNDDDQNRDNQQKAINELSSEDPTFKRFSLNDYMRRLEEQTRVKNETRDNEDLIDSIGEITQDVVPDSTQDENFDENISGISVDDFVDDETFGGDSYSVDTSELDAMKTRLEELRTQTAEINQLIDDVEEQDDEIDFDKFSENDDLEEAEDDFDESQDEESAQETQDDENIDEETDESLDEETQSNESDADKNENDESEASKNQIGQGGVIEQPTGFGGTQETSQQSGGQDSGVIPRRITQTIIPMGERQHKTKEQETDANAQGSLNIVIAKTPEEKSQVIMKQIEKNEQERKDIEDKLKQAEKDKLAAMKTYENRLKELEKSIQEKDKAHQEKVLQERIKNDNKLIAVRAEYETREAEIRRLEKESALKQKIGALLKKELKNNLSISNLEMNNKLLEITSIMNAEKQRAKAKPKTSTTKKRKSKRRIDSDIIGGINFD